VVEVKRTPEHTESLLWFCERCNVQLHDVTRHVADLERELKAAIEPFATRVGLRTCHPCGDVQPEQPPVPQPPYRTGSGPRRER
jgi:3-hydroxyanthranilate 3,4-dioxygenase